MQMSNQKSSPVNIQRLRRKLDKCIKNLISCINLLFETVSFRTEYKRKITSPHKDLGFNLLFSDQHQAYTLSILIIKKDQV